MSNIYNNFMEVVNSKSLRKKIIITLLLLALYRLIVYVPVPFLDIEALRNAVTGDSGLDYFAMLMGGTLQKFSIIAVGLTPFINASIIMQLLSVVIPHFEQLKEQGEQGSMKIQQYTRWVSFPLAFVQSIGIIYFINSLLGGVINVADKSVLLLSAFTLSVGTIFLVWLGELITEKGISSGTSLIIFSSIVSGIASKVYSFTSQSGSDLLAILIFMVLVVLFLVVFSIYLVKTRREIQIVYARQGKIQQTAALPIPLNPVGMVPIIFSIAFVSFPYLISQLILKTGMINESLRSAAEWVEVNFNIYSQSPSILAIAIFFMFILMFTYFYTLVTFNPDKIADNIQKKGGYIPGIRPGQETAKYINRNLMHLCLWGGLGLGFIGIYSYLLNYIPFISSAAQSLGSLPVIITGSGVIIIVGVVQDITNKVSSELMMEKYDNI